MQKLTRYALIGAIVATLAACGGRSGDGDGDGGGGTTTGNGSDLPDSALSSVEGLVAWANDVIARQTSDRTEPLALGDVKLPTSDTRDPI